MPITANYVHDAINRAIAQTPDAIDDGITKSVQREADTLLKLSQAERDWRLAELLGLFPEAIGRIDVDARLERAIAAQRTAAKAGHWSYDGNRLIALRGHQKARRMEQ